MNDLANTTGHNCQSCDRPDSAEEEMVQCHLCQLWEHFSCAGVDERVKSSNVQFVCKLCGGKQKASTSAANKKTLKSTASSAKGSKAGSKRGGKPLPSIPGSITSSSRAALLEEQLKLVDEERRLKEQELEEQREIKRRQMEESERQLQEKKKFAEEEKRLREQQLKEDSAMKVLQQQIRRESLEKRNEIIRQIAYTSSRGGSIQDSNEKVNGWLTNQEKVKGGLPPSVAGHSARLDQDQRPDRSLPALSEVSLALQDILDAPLATGGTSTSRASPPLPLLQASLNNERHDSIQKLGGLSQQQIAARQVLGKELPTFNGNPEDWPIFISCYEQSTATCGFSEAENLIRLQRCLKGHALESVKSRLLLPSSVQHVIQTLRTLYGRPELLIRSLMNKIHQVPAPRHDRLETLMQFGLSVQNLVDHLKAAGQKNHLSNPVLMQQLVEKLPGTMRLDWAVFKNRHLSATLETFGEFMSGLVTAASEVTFELPVFDDNARVERRKPKDMGILHAHSSEIEPPHHWTSEPSAVGSTVKTSQAGKICIACGRDGHRVADCVQFKAASVDERWKLVQLKGLCRTCLNSHGRWPCRSWSGCGIDGCRQRHHTLLHSSSPILNNVNVSASHSSTRDYNWPLFRVVPVVLYGTERSQITFAFIDEGSSYTLLEESVAKQLKVKI